MSKKRVFILGAGFSKQAGLPLGDELMSLLVEKAGLNDHGEFKEWLNDFNDRLKHAEGGRDDFKLNFEQCFDFAVFDIELWLMRQHLATVGRRDGPGTPYNQAKRIETWLGNIKGAIPHVFWAAQKDARLDKVREFTERLTDDDTVVTFNYDTLVEQALSSQDRPWRHGFRLEETGGVTVLKMHGSVDWIQLKRGEGNSWKTLTPLFSKTNVNLGLGVTPKDLEDAEELWRADDEKTVAEILGMDDVGLASFPYRFGIAGLGRNKPLHQLVGSGETWVNAFKALEEAEEVYAVGFSMSQYDTMTRFHFASVMRERDTKLSKAVVVDPFASKLKKRYRNVFNVDPMVVEKNAEDVNWQELL